MAKIKQSILICLIRGKKMKSKYKALLFIPFLSFAIFSCSKNNSVSLEEILSAVKKKEYRLLCYEDYAYYYEKNPANGDLNALLFDRKDVEHTNQTTYCFTGLGYSNDDSITQEYVAERFVSDYGNGFQVKKYKTLTQIYNESRESFISKYSFNYDIWDSFSSYCVKCERNNNQDTLTLKDGFSYSFSLLEQEYLIANVTSVIINNEDMNYSIIGKSGKRIMEVKIYDQVSNRSILHYLGNRS